jgi:hypothetical protein
LADAWQVDIHLKKLIQKTGFFLFFKPNPFCSIAAACFSAVGWVFVYCFFMLKKGGFGLPF